MHKSKLRMENEKREFFDNLNKYDLKLNIGPLTVLMVENNNRVKKASEGKIYYTNEDNDICADKYAIYNCDEKYADLRNINFVRRNSTQAWYSIKMSLKKYMYLNTEWGIDTVGSIWGTRRPVLNTFSQIYDRYAKQDDIKILIEDAVSMPIQVLEFELKKFRNELIWDRVKDKTHIEINISAQDVANQTGHPFLYNEKVYNPKTFKGTVDKVLSTPIISIGRDIDNDNKNTFDFITVELPIVSYITNKKEFIKRNSKEILKFIEEAVENNRWYKQYGVPFNFLKCTKIIITHMDVVMFYFDLVDSKTP